MAKSAKEKMKEYRERLKSDPQRYQLYLEKARARKRKNYIPVEQLTKRQKVERRAKTKEYVRHHRIKKKIDGIRNAQGQGLAENAAEPESRYDTQESAVPLIVNMPFPNRRNGPRKRTSKALAKKHREYNNLKLKYQNLEKKYKRNLRSFQRFKKLKINRKEEETPGEMLTEDISTPRSKTKQMMANAGVNKSQSSEIKKQLLFANVVQTQVKTYRRGMTQGEIGALRGLIGGKILSKYRLAKTINKSTGLGRNRIAKVASGLTHSQTSKRQREIARYRSRVEEFLLRDDNSRCNPGKQDKLKVNGENRQTRILTDYLKNLYSKFHGENPNAKLSLASFCRIRPPHIKLTRFISRSSCLCTKHQNVALCTQAMKKCGVSVPLNPEKFINDPANID